VGVARVAGHNGRMGILGADGAMLREPTYDHILQFGKEGSARTNQGGWLGKNGSVQGGQWGYLKADGTELVSPKYSYALDFEEGRATVEVKDVGHGILAPDGSTVVEPQYAYLSWHREGRAIVTVGNEDGYLDLDGRMVIEPRFDRAEIFGGGMAKVQVQGRFGLVRADGSWVSEPKWERMGDVRNGMVWAVGDGRVMILSADGGVFGPFEDARTAAWPADGIGHVPVKEGGTWGFLDRQGNRIASGHDNVWPYMNGRARIRDAQGKIGFIDERGQLVIGCHFEDAFNYDGGLAPVKHEGQWGVIDEAGQVRVAFQWDSAVHVKEGRARVEKEGRFGFIDESGKVIRAVTLDAAGHFCQGLAPALMVERVTVPVGAIEGVHQLPPEGLQHDVFDYDPGRHFIMVVGWSRELSITEELLVNRTVDTWERSLRVKPGGDIYTEVRSISHQAMYLRVEDSVADRRIELSTLLSDLRAANVPIQEVLFCAWGTPANSEAMAPVPDARMPPFQVNFPDFPAYWDACWDMSSEVVPASENSYYLKGAIVQMEPEFQVKCLEERHMPIWVPGYRVCFGALANQGEQYVPNDARTAEVQRSVDKHLAERWKDVWLKLNAPRFAPRAFTRDGSDGLEKITYAGRDGYCFAVSCNDLLQWYGKSRMRYREQELMEAMAAVTDEVGLAPVILWNRYSRSIPMMPMSTPNVVVVQLWER